MYQTIVEQRKRQAGKRYEHYIAQLHRRDGWQVEETGRDGFDDHGIDLIATRDGHKRYIQCKGWKRWKTISDDVISQLFGEVTAIEGIDNIENVELYVFSPARLSPYAREIADKLHVNFVRERYPRWKRRDQ